MISDLLDVDPDGLTDGEVVEHLLALHRLKARVEGALVAATGVFDRRQLFSDDAARSTAGWLAARVDQTRTRCSADADVARALRSMPVVEAAFRAGRLGRAKVDLLVQTRTPEVAEVFADQEAWLVSEVADLRVCDANRFLRAWQQQARLFVGSIDPDEPVVETAPRVAVSLAPTFEGRFVLDGEMDAEHGAIVRGAIDAEVDEMFRVGVFSADDGLTPAERRGQALVQIVTRKGHVGMRHGRPRPSVEVICDERTLQGLPITDADDLRSRICEHVDGTSLAPASLSRLLCGADLHRLVISAEGEVLDAGRPSDWPTGPRGGRCAPATGAIAPSRAARPPTTGARPTTSSTGTPIPPTIGAAPTWTTSSRCAATTTTRSTRADTPSPSNPTATSPSTDRPTTTATDVAPPPPDRGVGPGRGRRAPQGPSSRDQSWCRPSRYSGGSM